MKKILLSAFLLSLLALGYTDLKAQVPPSCGITNVLTQNIRENDINAGDGKCMVLFDASFTINAANANKKIFLVTYIETTTAPANPNAYPDYFNCATDGMADIGTTPQTISDLGTPLLLIVIDNTTGTPVFSNVYSPNPTPANNAKIKGVVAGTTVQVIPLGNGNFRFVLENIQEELPYECGSFFSSFISDVFVTSPNDATPDEIQTDCVNCSIRTVDDINIAGTNVCNVVNATLTNNAPGPRTITYSLYADINSDGNLIPTGDGGNDALLFTSGSINLASGATTNINYTITDPASLGKDVFVSLSPGGAELLPASCTVTPVKFKSFSANRKMSNVILNWETASEDNNHGFYIQRNTGKGWKDVSFVISKATGGNSNSLLAYEFTDLNTNKTVTQYRLMQVDLDGKSKFSDIRIVRGENGNTKTLIYPNPSSTGIVNVVFEDVVTSRNILLSDMSGRVIKQWNDYNAGNLQILNLMPGVYTIKIIDTKNGSQVNEKLVVNK